jgi:hypothetical protein
MTHPIGTARFMYGILGVAAGTMLFGAGIWAGRVLERRAAPPPAAVAADEDCDCDCDSDTDFYDEGNDYEHAQDAYVHGRYREAIAYAARSSDQRSLRIIGAASCFLHDAKSARNVVSHLDPQGRQFLKYVCSRNGITLP